MQDEEYGGFGGVHCMVPSGYSSLLCPQAASLDVRLSCPVKLIQDSSEGIQVTTESGAPRSCRAATMQLPFSCRAKPLTTFQRFTKRVKERFI